MKRVHADRQNIKEVRDEALILMRDAGFAIQEPVEVVVDKDLSFMGYTTAREGEQVIVVSGKALASGMAINLLVHELSHVYRTENMHPSHNFQLLSDILAWVLHGKALEPYQEKIIHSILNHLQDLYADDISFTIFAKNTSQDNLNDFFLGWIHNPAKKGMKEVKAWENADLLLSAAFAQANLERHNVKDTDEKIAKAIEDFLSQSDKRLVEHYNFFKTFMVNLPDEPTDKEFERLLVMYLGAFLKLTQIY